MFSIKKEKMPGGDILLYAYPLVYCVAALGILMYLDFQQLHNDFWDGYFVSRHLNPGDKATLWNGQNPIGYILFLKAVAGDALPVRGAILANLGISTVFLLACAVFFRKFMPVWGALIAVVLLSLFPEFFLYATNGGGDPGAMLLFFLGSLFLMPAVINSSVGKGSAGISAFSRRSPVLLGGFLLGLSATFRYHFLPASGFLLAALFVVYPKHWKYMFLASLGVCLGYAPQILVNAHTGHWPWETAFGPMNVYDLMYGINWHQTSTLNLPESSWGLIWGDPVLFMKKYLTAFFSFKQAMVPLVLAALFDTEPKMRRLFKALTGFVLIYFLVFSATTSGRQALLVLPFTFLAVGRCLVVLAGARPGFAGGRKGVSVLAATALVLGVFLLYVKRDVTFVARRAQDMKTYKKVEQLLMEGGVTRGTQVYTSDFNLYFRSLPPYQAHFNGGAPRWQTYLYHEKIKELHPENMEALIAACRRDSITHLVLDNSSSAVSEFFGDVYSEKRRAAGLRLSAKVDSHKIFKVLSEEPSQGVGKGGA